jgi:hypothetical protein
MLLGVTKESFTRTLKDQGSIPIAPPDKGAGKILWNVRVTYRVVEQSSNEDRNFQTLPPYGFYGYMTATASGNPVCYMRINSREGTILNLTSHDAYTLGVVHSYASKIIEALGGNNSCTIKMKGYAPALGFNELVFKGRTGIGIKFFVEYTYLNTVPSTSSSCIDDPSDSPQLPRASASNPLDRRDSSDPNDRVYSPPWDNRDDVTPPVTGANTSVVVSFFATILGCSGVETVVHDWVIPGNIVGVSLVLGTPITGCANLPSGQVSGVSITGSPGYSEFWSYWMYSASIISVSPTDRAPGRYFISKS